MCKCCIYENYDLGSKYLVQPVSDDGTHQSAGGHVSRLKKNVQPSLKFKYESVV